MIGLLIGTIMAGRPAVVNLAGGTITAPEDTASPYDGSAGVRVNADGTVDGVTYINGGAPNGIQVSAATDWIIPNAIANGDYDVRMVSPTGAALTTLAATENTWIALSADRLWSVERGSVGTSTAGFGLEIRDPLGVTVATGTYSCIVENSSGG